MAETLSKETLAELKAAVSKFGQSPRTLETLGQHSSDDPYVIWSQWEDTEPTVLVEIPDDDEWCGEFAQFLFDLWINRTALLRAAEDAERFRAALERIVEVESQSPVHAAVLSNIARQALKETP